MNNPSKKNQPDTSSWFEHVLCVLAKIFLLITVSTILFYKGAILYGFLFALFAYGYFFYGIFVDTPSAIIPYPYYGGEAWYAAESRRVLNEKQARRAQNRRSKSRSSIPVVAIAEQQSDFSDYDDFIDFDNMNSQSEYVSVNPSTLLPMIGIIDVCGNPYGCTNLIVQTSYETNDIFDCGVSDDFSYCSIDNDDYTSSSFSDDI